MKTTEYNYTVKNFEVCSLSSLNNIKNNSVLFYSDITNFNFKDFLI
jgi:hypothetical protein